MMIGIQGRVWRCPGVALAVAVLLAACTFSAPKATYEKSTAYSAYALERGEIVAINEARLAGEHTVVGTVGGGYVGNTVGRTVGDGNGARVAAAVGSVAGAVAGQAAEAGLRSQAALEITVRLDSGGELVVVQPAGEALAVGDRVRVLRRGNGEARVQPY